jgi:alanine racemase
MNDECRTSHDSDPASNSSARVPENSPLLTQGRPTWAEIDLENLVHNFRLMKDLGGPGVAVMPALKADAYGHGAIACARQLEKAGADWFGVALPEEGLKLREAGITKPILCLGGFWNGQEELIIANTLTPAIFQIAQLEAMNQAAQAAGRICDYHLKVDTGMGRLGVPYCELDEFLSAAGRFVSLRMDGVWTHLASADVPEQREFTLSQTRRFEAAVGLVRSRGFKPSWIHEANGAAAHGLPSSRMGFLNLIRPGGVIYGLWRDVTNRSVSPLDWKPVMSLHTRIAHLKTVSAGAPLGYGGTFVTERQSLIATLPIGYEDGLRRAESNKGHVLVKGRKVPIVGRVSMDLTLIDVTEAEGVSLGDEVMLIGRQGSAEIRAEEIAAEIGTISYEVTCGVSDRVPRIFRWQGF